MDRDPAHRGAVTAAAQATHTELHTLLATQRGRVVARLARSLGLAHLAQAEDAVQAAALQALQRQVRWKIADPTLLDPDSRHYVEFRFRLDMSQLPRPFQIGIVGNSEWNLSATRTYRLNPDSGK